jgi:ribose transport system ATP-binding protein
MDGRGVALAVSRVSKRFGPTVALDDVAFELARGSIHALLGGNGSGKSTLIKVLAGVESADRGRLDTRGHAFDLRTMTPAQSRAAGLRFVHQQRSTFPELTIAENFALGRGFEKTASGRIRWRQTRRHAAQVLERFGIDAHPDTEVGDLAPAIEKMVAIARALQDQDGAHDGVLLLDEPTAALPDAEVTILADALRRYAARGQTILYVTHRLEEVFAVADSATLLRDGQLVATVSPRELTHDDLVELIMGRPVEEVARLRGRRRGTAILEVRDLAAGPLEPLTLSLRAGEVVGVSGLIGSGRSSLLKALFGALERRSGEVRLDGARVDLPTPHAAMAAGFAYVPEDRAGDAAFAELSVKENLSIASLDAYSRLGRLRMRREDRDAHELLGRFRIRAESVEAPLSSLSGGNQQKAILARCLRRDPRVLLLDEPTQGVDVGAREEIYELVRDAVANGAAALLASSDSEELATVCDRVVVLCKGRLVGELAGDELASEELQRLAHTEIELERCE